MSVKKTSITALLAIPMPSNEPFEESGQHKHRTALYATLDELNSLSGTLEFPLFELGICNPTIEFLEESRRDDEALARWFATKTLASSEILRLSVEVPFPTCDQLDDLCGKLDNLQMQESVFLTFCRVFFAKRISDLLVMLNISRAGSIELNDSILIQDGKIQGYHHVPQIDAWSLQRGILLAESMGWPMLHDLNLFQAWNWAVGHMDLFDGFVNNSVGRALNALSRLLEKTNDEEPMKLLWALIGIEALYVKGNTGLIEQVREKSQVLLGPQTVFKKKFGQMYGFRSRFVHGDLDFPPLYLVGEARDQVLKYDKDLLDSIAFAAALLVASLQRIIEKEWSGLDFFYNVNDSVQAQS